MGATITLVTLFVVLGVASLHAYAVFQRQRARGVSAAWLFPPSSECL
jgi:hypothetical protein